MTTINTFATLEGTPYYLPHLLSTPAYMHYIDREVERRAIKVAQVDFIAKEIAHFRVAQTKYDGVEELTLKQRQEISRYCDYVDALNRKLNEVKNGK